jgi:diacylglycerol kinase family enzyme
MKYSFLINPIAGKTSIEEKKRLSDFFIKSLSPDCSVYGLETKSKEEFIETAKNASKNSDIIAIIGGDGTVQDILGTLQESQIITYFPLGSFNALKSAFNSAKSKESFIERLKHPTIRNLDTLIVNGQETLFSGIGFDCSVVENRDQLKKEGYSGKTAYWLAIGKLFTKNLDGFDAAIEIDGKRIQTKILDIMVSKVPFYGPRLKTLPLAKIDDELLHVTLIYPGKIKFIKELTQTYLSGNSLEQHIMGEYFTGKEIKIALDSPKTIHLNGNVFPSEKEYLFKVNPKRLRII